MFEDRHSSHGFRLSPVDALVLLLGAALPWWMWGHVGQFALLVPFVVLHFFLFCNVFRVPRLAELVWAGVFLVNFTAWLVSGAFSWWGVVGVQLPVTLAVIVHAIRRPDYHGIGSSSPGEPR